jgi:hypothetical protein
VAEGGEEAEEAKSDQVGNGDDLLRRNAKHHVAFFAAPTSAHARKRFHASIAMKVP